MRKKMAEKKGYNDSIFGVFRININLSMLNKNKPKFKRKEDQKPVCNLEEEKLKLFGEHFVQVNKSKCKLEIEGQEMDLCEYYTTKSKEKTIIIKLFVKETIEDFVGMFKDCRNLLACPDLDTLDTSKATSFKGFFENCESLCLLPKFVSWNTSKVTDMNSLFSCCASLDNVPDFSNWKTSNVTDVNLMFQNCKSLSSLPDISKWDLSQIENFDNLFEGCQEDLHMIVEDLISIQ